MSKMELEVKVLDINKKNFIKKLESLNATFKIETKQYLYTYDLPTIYGRFVDIKTQLIDNESKIKYETAIEKLKLLFFELDNLLTEQDKKMMAGIDKKFDIKEIREAMEEWELEQEKKRELLERMRWMK